MIQALLEGGGHRSERDIARALMSFDVSQVEYYELRTRNMVGRVLRPILFRMASSPVTTPRRRTV